ncbi:Ribokinase-like protein [Chaetomium fimeti]|uniref:ATP-dependent (S)-NAD(P)H-hydrate dehydratase n=1 Tax=Chaetomium fimeti TaxID=1854472 RepID=A0AAE0LX37_9PEZI|nr:Ribokinase-like protein [Chaetomium fimeti]
MSPATKDVIARVRQMIPPMLDKFHKGQLGRVGVIGGSEDYTGAPYFSAMASARLGCDMSHVICTPAAAAVIKTYSPNLMVHPLMRNSPPGTSTSTSTSTSPETDASTIAERIIPLLDRLHVLVVGPGLGRDRLMQDTCAVVLRAARARGMPVVLDADALQIVQRDPALVRGYALAVLTPNVVEFARLARALGVEGQEGDVREAGTAAVEALARVLEGVMVLQKGGRDNLSDGRVMYTVDLEGGRKRSGGQGDTLTGSIATFLGWRKAYLDGIWETGGRLKEEELVALAVFGGSAITRECSRLAFAKKGRSLQASDLTDEVHTAFLNIFGEVNDDSSGARL